MLQVVGSAQAQLPIPEDLEISIVLGGTPDRYLNPRKPDAPWVTEVYRFKPPSARREGAMLLIELDHAITYHIKPSQPYRLLIRQVENLEIEERFTGLGVMRRDVAKPTWTPSPTVAAPESRAEPARQASTPAPAAEPVTAPPPPPPPPSPPPPPPPIEQKPRKILWIGLGGLALLAVLAAAYLQTRPAEPEDHTGATQPVAAQRKLDSLAAVRDYLGADPPADQAMAQGRVLAEAGQLLDGQFLLFKYAAERGDNEAARRIGAFYDPATWSAGGSPMQAANPLEAARWYKQAAEAGDAEAQYRYAMLLKRGGTDEADGPEQAVLWLRKAAEQGHEAAKKEAGG